MDEPAAGSPTSEPMFLVERYWPDIDERGARDVVVGLENAARLMTAEGTPVAHVGSILIPADQVVLSLIAAADESTVLAVNARAEMPLHRVAPAIALGIKRWREGE